MKNISIILLIVQGITYQVDNKNRCADCSQFKSQRDCEQQISVNGTCEWRRTSENNAGICQKAINQLYLNYTPYCGQVDMPKINCAKTLGCAYIDSNCTHFTGCQAYVKTKTQDCQAISYLCISDGNACIKAKSCKDYTPSQCESTPSASGILKCKWDIKAAVCRDYYCSEANPALDTDEKCSAWLLGCVTKGQGCTNSPRPTCANYTGDDAACQSYFGADGNCELATGTTNCKCKECQNAPTSLITDDDCKVYQKGCITTGKGCILGATKPLCSAYSGDNITCVGYIGSDGVCEGDAGGSKCRARKCQNGTFTTDELCKQYQSSCKTNGKNCVSSLSACNTYKGNVTTCAIYIGTDGFCKGISTITEDNCVPKNCDEAPDTNTTDESCNIYSIGCVTTGKGCVVKSNLKSCTTYDGDSNSCQSRVGSEGKCTWKSGTKCIARDCISAPITMNTNPLCANYFTNCVTTGSGCVDQTSCDASAKQQSCEGTKNCSWQSICISNTLCSEFKMKSICLANPARVKMIDKYDDDGNPIYIYVTKRCRWFNGICQELTCSDLKGAYYNNDANCSAALSTCISNKVDGCITRNDCTKQTGTQSTCLNYPGYCTNIASATESSTCTQRKCSDNIVATDNDACAKFQPGCISNGQGCVVFNTACKSMKGNQETCNKIFAFKSGSIDNFVTNQCYNSASATANDYCKVKTCKLAENQTDNSCGQFLEGCVYNGNGGCVDPKADDTSCASYTGVAEFCGDAIVGRNEKKYCFGTSTSGTCALRTCEDNTTATKDDECDTFKLGCIAKSDGGCVSKSLRLCSQQSGTVTTCPNFSGGLYVLTNWTKVGCTKYDACQERLCSDITNPGSPSDCLNYKSTCRFLKPESPCIDQTSCGNYSLPDTATTDQQKFDYCTTIKDNSGLLCGYTVGATKCSRRTCAQFLSTYTILQCAFYLLKDISTHTNEICQLAGTICYLPQSDCQYNYATSDNTDDLKLTQCKKFKNDKRLICSYKSGDSKCSLQDSCEKLIIQTDAKSCNDQTVFTSGGLCQKLSNSSCTTLSTSCTSYTFDLRFLQTMLQESCWSLRQVDDLAKVATGTAVYSRCTYKTGTQCDQISACSDIYSASNQAECEAYKLGCLYYRGQCYAAVSTGGCPTSFPRKFRNDSEKSLYCRSIKETINYCRLTSNKSSCELADNADCAAITIPTTGSWDFWTFSTENAFKQAYCLAQTYKDRTKLCQYVPIISTTACSDANCADIPSPTNQGDCDNYISGCIFYNFKCYVSGVIVTDSDCSDNAKVAMASELTAFNKLEYCQLFNSNDKSIYCTYNQYQSEGAPIQCVAGENCNQYTSMPISDRDKQAYCQKKISKVGKKCAYTIGSSGCRDFDCYDIQNPTSQIDCDLGAPGVKCKYLLGTCYIPDQACTNITAQSRNEKYYCDRVVAVTKCTYITGTTCTVKIDCHLYSVSINKAKVCATLTDTANNECTYLGGNNCVKLGTCSSYDGAIVAEKGPTIGQEEQQCKAVKSIDKYPCIKDQAKKCREQVCSDNDESDTDCANNVPNCLYFFGKCIAKNTCANYQVQGDHDIAKQAWCERIWNTNGDFCAWDSINKKCRDRQCSDQLFYTNIDCQNYLKICKTDGTKCVANNVSCNSSSGSSDFCRYLLDQTGNDYCKLIETPSTTVSSCITKTCYDNVTATTDFECDTYLSGCVTRGKGCIPNTEPCTSYRGTQQQCESFKIYTGLDDNKNLIYEYCSGLASNTEIDVCKSRTCSDNTTATSDLECAAYLKGCKTKGEGCVDVKSSCIAYQGDQATCSKFIASSGKDYCWNKPFDLPISICFKKFCSDIPGKNNKECNDGMPPFKTTDDPFCVFDGILCIDYGRVCSAFVGTEETCPTFLARDGPCKATTDGTIRGACAKRVCAEAPNTLQTDADCQKYHKDCYTTGYGCTSINQCQSKISKHSCQEQKECSWVKYCIDSITTCETYNNTSYSQCANSRVNGKFCFWNEQNLTCKSQTCKNLPATLDSHEQCQNFDENCTTTGDGCITISLCRLYKKKSICNVASSSKDGLQRCIWDNQRNICRNKVCNDISAKINVECEQFNLDCRFNGQTCTPGLSCTEFQNQLFCIASKKGPCLWVDGFCYDYTKCEDANKKTFIECQAFSPLCTTNGYTCIPITTCENTIVQISCVVGLDGPCGWLPSKKCQKFGQCTDAVAATNDECLSYGPTCITDGTSCIDKSTCSSYKTQILCDNKGIDGICFWNPTANTCKLKECRDVQESTYDLCKLISFTGESCTTDGITCIPLSICSSYVEAGCFNGTDGECIFALPIGVTEGTKICRLKQCEDISATDCMGINSANSCVSNGINCIVKAPCSSYNTISACNGGGLENNKLIACAFTPTGTDKVNGTCKIFSTCSDANQDKFACESNLSCKWTENSSKTTCNDRQCETLTTEAFCNPIPSFDGSYSTICALKNGICISTDPITITNPKLCYIKSAYTHSWNTQTSKCDSCIPTQTQPKNPQDSEDPITNQQTSYIFFFSFCLSGFLVQLL